MQKLIATKSMSYGTRRLMPGEPFEAKDKDAKLLIGIKKAEAEREPGSVPPPPAELQKQIADDHAAMTELRAEYERVIGKKAFHAWDADTLRAKMAEVASQVD